MTDGGFVDRTDIAAVDARLLEDFIASVPREACRFGIRLTSGTSDTPIVSVLEYGDRQFSKYAETSNLLICMGSRNVRLANTLHFRHARGEKPRSVLNIDNEDVPRLGNILEDLMPDEVSGTASFIGLVLKVSTPVVPQAIRTFRLAGERLEPARLKSFRSLAPLARITMFYGTNEIGLIGVQCTNLPPNVYHEAPDVKIDIIDRDETEVGDIIVSKILSYGEHIERYAIGDIGRLSNEPCVCGAPVTFEHLGRGGNDYIKISGTIVRREEFDRVAALFAHSIDDYRVEAGEKLVNGKLKGSIILHVFSRKGQGTPALAEEIARNFSRAVFLTPTQTLADLVGKGAFLPLTVTFSAKPFPQKHKDVKLRRVSQ